MNIGFKFVKYMKKNKVKIHNVMMSVYTLYKPLRKKQASENGYLSV